jgi:hypothetical protein
VVVAVSVASVVFIAPAGAGTVSGVAVSASSSVSHDLAATWTVTLQSSATGALDGANGDFVTVVFPAGITVAVPPLGASLSTGFAGSCSAPPAVATGQSVEVDLPAGCSLPASAPATITFTGIDPAAGTYQASGFTVSSSIDATAAPASGSDIVIGGGGGGGGTQVSAVSFAPTDASAGASASWTIGFTSSSGGALAGGAGFGYVVVTFPSGFGVASSATFGSGFSCNGSHPVVQDVGGNTDPRRRCEPGVGRRLQRCCARVERRHHSRRGRSDNDCARGEPAPGGADDHVGQCGCW